MNKEEKMRKSYMWLFLVLVAVGVATLSGCAGWDMGGGDSSSHSGHSGGHH